MTELSRPRTISEILKSSAERFGPRVALQMKKDSSYQILTYAELYERSSNVASFLRASGVKRGDRIGLLSENRPEWAIVYFGILGCGGVVVGIDVRLKPGEIEHILSHSETKLLFISSQFAGHKLEQPTISMDGDMFAEAVSQAEGLTETGSDPGELAMLVYTSGTTGAPKGVMLTHKNVVSNVMGAYDALPARSADNFLSLLPLSHMLELVGGLLGPLYCGATISYVPTPKPSVLQATMKETRTTVMQGVPLLFRMFYKEIMRKVEDSIQPIPVLFSFNMKIARLLDRLHVGKLLFRQVRREFGGRIKYFVSGGAALAPEVVRAFRCLGMPILEGYGLTEASPIVSVNTPAAYRAGSVGRPLPGVTVKTADDGEIVVSGPNVMKGYYRDPESTAKVLRDGELHTGDIGFLDRDGFLHITGRKKNVIVTAAGENVYPEDVEVVLAKSPFASEICVVGRKQKRGERPFLFVIPDYDYLGKLGMSRDDATVRKVLQEEIKRLSMELADYQRVCDFAIFKGEFPQTSSRKTKRFELQRIANEERAANDPQQLTDGLTRRIRRIAAEIGEVSEETVYPDSDLGTDLGMDSLLRVEMLTALEEDCGICVPDELAHSLRTIRDIVQFARRYEKGQAPAAIALHGDEESYSFLKRKSALRQFIKGSLSLVLRLFSKWYFSLEVKKVQNVLGLESFIITPNHNSLLDVPVVLSSLPRLTAEKMFSPAAKDYFFDRHPIRRWLIRLAFDTFPFDRHGDFMKGLRKCKRTIEEGKSLILFPEGTRSVSGALQPFKVGLGAIAFDLDIPVVPTYVKGIHEAFGKGMLFPRARKIEVRFGEPILMDPYRAKGTQMSKYEIYKEIIGDVRKAILRLT